MRTRRQAPVCSLAIFLALATLAACSPRQNRSSAMQVDTCTGLTRLFHSNPRWLGGDAVLSVPLSPDRVLWLFGDTFIATTDAMVRRESTMVGNSIAIQTGMDLREATMEFFWQEPSPFAPEAFLADPIPGEMRYWPGHGIRLQEGPLLLFWYRTLATSEEALGFANAGYVLAVVDTPDAPPPTWTPRIYEAPEVAFDAVPATAVLRLGDHIVALAVRQQGTHAGALVRYPVDALMLGDMHDAQWWAGSERGWVPASALGTTGPTMVMDDAGAEGSLHWDAQRGEFVHVASYGFGNTTIGLRTAPQITGPWSAPVTVYHPPESRRPRPFVYAAKAHPGLTPGKATELIITYATNSFDFDDLLSDEGSRSLYWPHCIALPRRR